MLLLRTFLEESGALLGQEVRVTFLGQKKRMRSIPVLRYFENETGIVSALSS
jgi:hypothetical protein